MEQRLLSLLHDSANRIVPTEDLVLALYGRIGIQAGRCRLKRLVADIRGRLGAAIGGRLQTVPKVGLVLVVDDPDRDTG
jgi:DNA-binding winged helix-turn-helix (wHTH) protein